MNTFLLIDGNAMLYRAYHAMPELTKNGQMVNAVYGFFSMLINVMADQNPSHLAVCFDRSKPTIRQSMFAGYHQNRPSMEDNLKSQISLVDALLSTLKAPTFSLDGYEGDDLIGTIATRVVQNTRMVRASERHSVRNADAAGASDTLKHRSTEFSHNNLRVLILTGDRDMLQLVNERVHVLMPIVGLTKSVEFTPEKVEEKYGVKASQFVDYKALIGDPSDGYPGVTGIGPKTAASLLKQYPTFEALYEHIGELPEKIGTKLALDAEQAALAKKLATIITDVPMQFDITSCAVESFDLHGLHRSFGELSFNSLITRLEARFPQMKEAKKKESDGQMELL